MPSSTSLKVSLNALEAEVTESLEINDYIPITISVITYLREDTQFQT